MKLASGIAAVFGFAAIAPALAGEGTLGNLQVTYTETSRSEGRTYLDDKRTKWNDYATVRGDITTFNKETGRTCTSKNGYILFNVNKGKGTETLTGVIEMNAVCAPKK